MQGLRPTPFSLHAVQSGVGAGASPPTSQLAAFRGTSHQVSALDEVNVAQALKGHYELERELRPGGMSRVFLARDVALRRLVVVKVLPTHLMSASSIDRFKREVLLTAGFQHPNIVGVIGAGEVDGLPYYVMPFIEGESLAERIREVGQFSIAETTLVLRDVLRALSYAHARGIIHRDIKPQNVLLVGGAAMVADFGVAKAAREAQVRTDPGAPKITTISEPLTGTGMSIGTPLYMAPEQATGDPNIDGRADLYALGATAYEMLAGTPPFHSMPAHELLRAKLMEDPPRVGSLRPETSPELDELVTACLARDPSMRPATADEALAFLHESGERPRRSANTVGGVKRVRRRMIATSAVGVVLAMVALGWAWRATRRSVPPAPAVAAAPVVPGVTTIIVSPFIALSGSKGDTQMAEGLTTQVANAFTAMKGVKVIAPTYAQSLLRSGVSPEELTRRTGAHYLAEGTIEESEGHIRVTARLVSATDGVMQWAGSYDRKRNELFALEDTLVREMVEGLGAPKGVPNGGGGE
ncbi:MAG: protein kinase [Gemmatimonadetes bacterium]|nr:protein kinase [Gemmatimonadota bacterium]